MLRAQLQHQAEQLELLRDESNTLTGALETSKRLLRTQQHVWGDQQKALEKKYSALKTVVFGLERRLAEMHMASDTRKSDESGGASLPSSGAASPFTPLRTATDSPHA